MTDQPVREPMPPDPARDRVDADSDDAAEHEATAEDADQASMRPSKAEGPEEDAGLRPPRPSQAEGERDPGTEDEG